MTCRQHLSFPFVTRIQFLFSTYARLVIVLICCYMFLRNFHYALITIHLHRKILPP